MSLKLIEIIREIESVAPLLLQESYDNSGLLIGDVNMEIHSALICLDCTEAVVDEAIKKGCNLIVAHHPVIFGGLKKLVGQNEVQRVVVKAIQHHLAIYACHTNLDNVLSNGVNGKIAQKLDLQNNQVLLSKEQLLYKLEVFVPTEHAQTLKQALFAAGAGSIGNYSECSFSFEGQGSFRPQEGANPTLGQVGDLEHVNEMKIEVVFPKWLKSKVLNAMFFAHPYEEIAYQVLSTENSIGGYGTGVVGTLKHPMTEREFLAYLKDKMELDVFRYTRFTGKEIKKVAICGGSGAFLIGKAKAENADVYISADIKYHEFFDAENQLLICDIGHFESEKYTIELIIEIISKKFPNFATIFAETNTNPIQYYR
jgi:dinuclear metal center YbgI/SA1388 family protein